MPYIGDSRRPRGPGILPLQDFGFHGKDPHERGALLAVRLDGRLDGAGELGHWVEDVDSRGDVGGGLFWSPASRATGAWQFAWPAKIPRSGTVTGADFLPSPTTTPTSGSDDSFDPGTQIRIQGQVYDRRDIGLSFFIETDKDLTPEEIRDIVQPGANEIIRVTQKTDEGFWVAVDVKQVPVVGGGFGNIPVGVPLGPNSPGLVGGAFGFGGPVFGPGGGGGGVIVGVGLNPGAPGLIGGAFGLGVPAWKVAAPGLVQNGNLIPLIGGQWAVGFQPAGQAKNDNLVAAWYSGEQESVFATDLATSVLPIGPAWLTDDRWTKKNHDRPEGFPRFPKDWHFVALTATDEGQQKELLLPADPRLVAVNSGRPASMGTYVTDVTGDGSTDYERYARLHSMLRVVQRPRGEVGALVGGNKKRTNWLSWNIGPSGQWDTVGGLVTDVPTSGESGRNDRVHAHASMMYGGPFDVGHAGDEHEIGTEADGTPINSLHISTEALFKRKGGGPEDGPMLFEAEFREGIDLSYPIDVHLAYDLKSGFWRWWTTTLVGTITPTVTPDRERDPEPPPDTPPTTTPPTTGGGADDPGRRPDRRDQRQPDRNPHPIPIVTGDISTERFDLPIAATTLEFSTPSQIGRPQRIAQDEPLWMNRLDISPQDIEDHDLRTPATYRLQAFGAQGGEIGGSVFSPGAGAQEGGSPWAYTQEPGRSRVAGGTAPGGLVFMAPEVDLSAVDDDLAPDNHTRSTVYMTTAPGAYFGAGIPDLPSGGVRDGFSWGLEDGDLQFREHDSTATATDVIAIQEGGYFRVPQLATPGANAPAGTALIYAKADGKVYAYTAGGSEFDLTAGGAGASDHGSLTGLGDDDHLQYPLSAGRSSGQSLTGGTASAEQLTLESTSHATKGGVRIAASDFMEIPEIAAPGTPSSGFGRLYSKSGGLLYWKDDGGTEYDLTADTDTSDHGALSGLTDDDHSQYVHTSVSRSISAQHEFAPGSAQPPFTLGANAQEQETVGLYAARGRRIPVGALASRPATPEVGELYLDTDNGLAYIGC